MSNIKSILSVAEAYAQMVTEANTDHSAAANSASEHAKNTPSMATHHAASNAHEKAASALESQINKIKETDHTGKHDDKVMKMERELKSHQQQAQRHRFHAHRIASTQKESYELTEKLDPKADAGTWIHDFVHSDDPKFAGKSAEERKNQALAAYYSARREAGLKNEDTGEAGDQSNKRPDVDLKPDTDNLAATDAATAQKKQEPQDEIPSWVPGNIEDKKGFAEAAKKAWESDNNTFDFKGRTYKITESHLPGVSVRGHRYPLGDYKPAADHIDSGPAQHSIDSDGFHAHAKHMMKTHGVVTSFDRNGMDDELHYHGPRAKVQKALINHYGGDKGEAKAMHPHVFATKESTDKELVGNQKKLDVNNNGKIDADDLAALRAGKPANEDLEKETDTPGQSAEMPEGEPRGDGDNDEDDKTDMGDDDKDGEMKESIDNPTDKLTLDVPAMIRSLEKAREDFKSDEDVHNFVQGLLAKKDSTIDTNALPKDTVKEGAPNGAFDPKWHAAVMKAVDRGSKKSKDSKKPNDAEIRKQIQKKNAFDPKWHAAVMKHFGEDTVKEGAPGDAKAGPMVMDPLTQDTKDDHDDETKVEDAPYTNKADGSENVVPANKPAAKPSPMPKLAAEQTIRSVAETYANMTAEAYKPAGKFGPEDLPTTKDPNEDPTAPKSFAHHDILAHHAHQQSHIAKLYSKIAHHTNSDEDHANAERAHDNATRAHYAAGRAYEGGHDKPTSSGHYSGELHYAKAEKHEANKNRHNKQFRASYGNNYRGASNYNV